MPTLLNLRNVLVGLGIKNYNDKVTKQEKAKNEAANANYNLDAFKKNVQPLQDYNTDFTNTDAYKNSLSGISSAANPIDLSGIIADYQRNNQATIDTLNKSLSDTINTLRTSNEQSRNDLLTSLKRFQESNAESMRQQQQDFNSSRATLEDETFMNQRNSLANAASRGLGGSGLQQLAQLQNRIAAGRDLSSLAQKNQNAQDTLRKALSQKQEDYDTNVSKLEANLANAIIQAQNDTASKINAANTNTTNIINNLRYNEAVRQQQASAQAASARANLLASMNQGVNLLRNTQDTFNRELESTVNSYLAEKGKSSIKQLSSADLANLSNTLSDLYNDYAAEVNLNIPSQYNLDKSYTDTALSNLRNIYNKYRIY